ncbi:hypothetical protein SK128_002891 [Halocaridina rubra]|uniref:Uncharacterized protein n=1 Tax=Halocaridina rubra TaxID=373956 RepID=A0AAN8X0V7_HALRR
MKRFLHSVLLNQKSNNDYNAYKTTSNKSPEQNFLSSSRWCAPPMFDLIHTPMGTYDERSREVSVICDSNDGINFMSDFEETSEEKR